MAKSIQMFAAQDLRSKGESIKEIARKLSVSPGSVSVWCRDIELTPQQIQVLEKRAKDPYYGERGVYLAKLKMQTNKKITDLKNLGIKTVGKLTSRELFLVGVGLYWAEGFKKDKQVGFANTDPKMINFYTTWLNGLGYKTSDLSARVTLNITHKDRAADVESYWSKQTKIPIENFGKPFFQNTVWKKTYQNPEAYYGVLRVKVKKSLDFLRMINGYVEGLKLNSTI